MNKRFSSRHSFIRVDSQQRLDEALGCHAQSTSVTTAMTTKRETDHSQRYRSKGSVESTISSLELPPPTPSVRPPYTEIDHP